VKSIENGDYDEFAKIANDSSKIIYLKTKDNFRTKTMPLDAYKIIYKHFYETLTPVASFKQDFDRHYTELENTFIGDKDDHSSQKYLIINPRSGLANRMRALASAYVMAVTTGRELVIDWKSNPQETPVDSLNHLFENDSLRELDHDIQSRCGDERVFLSWEDSGYGDQAPFVYNRLSNLPFVKNKCVEVESFNNFKPNHITEELYFKLYRNFYANHKYVSEIQNIVTNVYANRMAGKRVVGVHHRSFTLTNDWHPTPDYFSVYYELMNGLIAKDPQVLFFVSADSVEFKKKLQNKFGNRIITIEHGRIARDNLQDSRNSVVDWNLLAKTEFIIGTYQSSFSEEAALLTATSRKINIGRSRYDFHSIYCFDNDGKVFMRGTDIFDVCAKYSR